MTTNEIEDRLKAFLLDPSREWSIDIPAISNYKDSSVLISNNRSGIHINFTDSTYTENSRLGAKSTFFKNLSFDLQFYTNDTQTQKPFVDAQTNINKFFNSKKRHNKVTQAVKLKNINNNWEIENISSRLVSYNMYGDNNHPDLSSGKEYLGYKVKDNHNNNKEHFLYRVPQSFEGDESWNVLDLDTHLHFPVHKFSQKYTEVLVNGDTYFYEFIPVRIFTGHQSITLSGMVADYNELDSTYGELIRSDMTLIVNDYSQDSREESPVIFETPENPSHVYSPVVYNKKFLIAATSTDSTFSTAEWRSGVKVEDSLSVTFRPTTTNTYRGIALSSDKITGISQDNNPFGNVISAYDYNGIIDVDNIKYYSYKTKNSYFPISETHQYTVVEDDDRDAFLISYLSGDTGESHSVDDFTFNNAEIEADPNRNYYEISIDAETPSYIAILFTGGNINRIMDGNTNIRNTFFTPTVDQPFIQKVVRGRIFNAFISNRTFFTISSWRLFY